MPDIILILSGLITGAVLMFFILGNIYTGRLKEASFSSRVLDEKLQQTEEKLIHLGIDLKEKEQLAHQLGIENAVQINELNSLKQKLEDQKEEANQLQERLKIEFRNLANDILEEKSRKFTLQNRENLNEVLTPFGQKIREFEKKVEETYEKGLKEHTDLKSELKRLHELNIKLDEDARNLTRALKSDTKKQGNWGEIVLERVLERSGLVKGEEYVTQSTYRNDQGELLRPDVVINLPEKKHLIIDSKVSLTAYQQYSDSENEETKKEYLKQHIQSIKTHIKNLSEKNYQFTENLDTPDFVLMFMPVEPALGIALQAEPEIFPFAWDRKIVVVSPTTLLATLRTIASIWKHEKQTQNAIEIARQGGMLYDKFVLFLQDIDRLGSQLSTLNKTYDDVHKKIASGSGNLIKRAEKMRELGAKTNKQIPESWENEE